MERCFHTQIYIANYLVLIERNENEGYDAYVPKLPGCVASAETEAEVERLITEAIPTHLDSLQQRAESA